MILSFLDVYQEIRKTSSISNSTVVAEYEVDARF